MNRAAVLFTIQRKDGRWLIQANFARERIDIAQHISHNRYPVGLAKVHHMARCMSGGMDDAKPGYFVAITQASLDWIRWPGERKLHNFRGGIPGDHGSASLH